MLGLDTISNFGDLLPLNLTKPFIIAQDRENRYCFVGKERTEKETTVDTRAIKYTTFHRLESSKTRHSFLH